MRVSLKRAQAEKVLTPSSSSASSAQQVRHAWHCPVCAPRFVPQRVLLGVSALCLERIRQHGNPVFTVKSCADNEVASLVF